MIWIACAVTAVITAPLGAVAMALVANRNVDLGRTERRQLTEW